MPSRLCLPRSISNTPGLGTDRASRSTISTVAKSCALVLAECVEGKGRFLDAAADALWAICEESSWCLPAHVSRQQAGVGLPDVEEPTVDLFAGETGVSVAWTLYLLGPELQRVSRGFLRVHAANWRSGFSTPFSNATTSAGWR